MLDNWSNATFKITFRQHDENNFGVQVCEHFLHAPHYFLFGGIGERGAGWKVVRKGRLLITRVVAEAPHFWRPAGDSGRALAVLLPPRHSAAEGSSLVALIRSGHTELFE